MTVSTLTTVVIVGLVFLIAGAIAGWLLGSARARSADAVKLARAETAHQLLTQRTEALEADASLASELTGAVGPLAAGVKQLQADLGRQERERAGEVAGLRQQITSLSLQNQRLQDSTGSLSHALNATSTRGDWGEVQLRRIVEYAGMLERVDFSTQLTTASGSRPDLVVHLPGAGSIVVDAKTPMSARIRQPGEAFSPEHAKALLRHVDALASKAYWAQFESSPEFVVCFVPTDGLLSAAGAAYPQLVDQALRKNVVLASPSTLLVLLKTVALNWRQYDVSRSAKEVLALGQELYERTGTLADRLAKLGMTLGRAVGDYNGFVGSFESRFLVTARKFRSTGIGAADIERTDEVDAHVRRAGADELRSNLGGI